MTLQAISKGFEYYKKCGLRFSIKTFPSILLYGFIASIGSTNYSEGISYQDSFFFLINVFLVTPFIIIFSIYLANDLIENKNRDILVYYVDSWRFLIKVLILWLVTTLTLLTVIIISIQNIFLLILGTPLTIFLFVKFLYVNYFAILEDKSILNSLKLSWRLSDKNYLQNFYMASFYLYILILSVVVLYFLATNYIDTNQVPRSISFVINSLAIYIQACLISFPILVFYKNQSLDEIKDSI